MEKVKGWWFGPETKRLGYGDGRQIRIGRTHKVKGEIIPCKSGLHLSRCIIDALEYSPGPIIYKVEGSGEIHPHGSPIDKFACSERTYLAGGFDCSKILHKFSRLCALDVIHLWDAPEIVVQYLKTGDESLRDAARAAARAAAARDAAGGAARGAARAGARGAAWAAARAAAWATARAAARAAARGATRAAAWDAAWAAARAKQNKRLTGMINRAINESRR